MDRTPAIPDGSLALDVRTGLPETLRALLDACPRIGWTDHPNFEGLTRFWLERHLMFRQVLDRMLAVTDTLADGGAPDVGSVQIYRLAELLLGELHGHHRIEDGHYFPELRRLAPALALGFDLLDRDHLALDRALGDFATDTNAVLQSLRAGDRGQAPRYRDALVQFRRLLDRHLEDEEDLVVPVLLKHGGP